MSSNPASCSSLVGILVPVLVLSLAGCGLLGDRRDTAHEGAASGRALEIPPDLLPPELDATYRVPARDDGRVSAVEAEQRERPSGILGAGSAPGTQEIALRQVEDMTVRREGNVRWLEISAAPAGLWSSLRGFWREQEFELTRDEPTLGIMETEWKETRAGVPITGIRGQLSRFLGTQYDAGLRDQYRIRLERESEDRVHLYLTHRGVDQVIDEERGGVRWAMRPSDPELEAEMLIRLMVHLGRDEGQARGIVNLAADESPPVREREVDGQPGLELRGQFSQVWRQVGLGLDRAGLLVDDQDRRAGVFHVTYSRDAARSGSEGGFLSRLFSRDPVGGDGRYQVRLAQDGDWVRITVQDREGNALRASDAASVLELLRDEIY